jgi:DNA-directed RNA polymerase specialized sigma subunit
MSNEYENVFLSRDSLTALDEPTNRLEPKYQDVYNRWKTQGTQQDTDDLLEAITPVIQSIVHSMPGTDSRYLETQGKIVAMKAMKNYDPKKSSINTYLSQNLQSLRRKSRSQMNILGIPDRLLTSSMQYDDAEVTLEEELGRPPTTQELADKMKISAKQIERIRELKYPLNSGALASQSADSESSGMPQVERRLPVVYRHEYVLSALQDNPIGQVIYEMDNGLHKRKPMGIVEMAKELKVSPSLISRQRNAISEISNRAEKEIYGL